MMTKLTPSVSLFALCSVLFGAAALSAQTTLVSEDWSEYTAGSSPIGNGYVWGTETNPSNTATIIKDPLTDKHVLSVFSIRGATGGAPRVQKAVSLDLSNSLTTTVSGEIRYQSPGSTYNTGYPTFAVSTNLGQVWYGFSARNALFINMPSPGGGAPAPTQLKLTLGANINTSDWYRFTLDFDHTTGGLGLSVALLDGLDGSVVDTVWTISNVMAGYDEMHVTGITAYRFEVSRPGAPIDNQITSDFSGIKIETVLVPEPSTVAVLMGLGVLGAVIALRRRHLRR